MLIIRNLEDTGFITLIKDFIVETMNPQFGEYDNLGLNSSDLSKLRMLVIAFFAAIVVGAFMTCFNKSIYGKLVTALNREAAWSPAKAKTLQELDCHGNAAIRRALRSGSTYRKLVHCVEQDKYESEISLERDRFYENAAANGDTKAKFKATPFAFDFDLCHFYIPEGKSIGAESRFEKRGSGFLTVLLIIIAAFIAMLVVMHFLPDMVQLLDNFAGGLNS